VSGMADVTFMHSQMGLDDRGRYCKACGAHYGHAAETELHRRASAHVAAMLTAAGFGPVQGEKRLMQLAALMAYDAVEEIKIRNARAEAWDEASKAIKSTIGAYAEEGVRAFEQAEKLNPNPYRT